MAMKDIMGVDQFGNTYHALGKHPRKELLCRTGRSYARKLYIDKKGGTIRHVGYAIGDLWITLFTVTPFEKFVKEW
jgi:hypothetical protein